MAGGVLTRPLTHAHTRTPYSTSHQAPKAFLRRIRCIIRPPLRPGSPGAGTGRQGRAGAGGELPWSKPTTESCTRARTTSRSGRTTRRSQPAPSAGRRCGLALSRWDRTGRPQRNGGGVFEAGSNCSRCPCDRWRCSRRTIHCPSAHRSAWTRLQAAHVASATGRRTGPGSTSGALRSPSTPRDDDAPPRQSCPSQGFQRLRAWVAIHSVPLAATVAFATRWSSIATTDAYIHCVASAGGSSQLLRLLICAIRRCPFVTSPRRLRPLVGPGRQRGRKQAVGVLHTRDDGGAPRTTEEVAESFFLETPADRAH